MKARSTSKFGIVMVVVIAVIAVASVSSALVLGAFDVFTDDTSQSATTSSTVDEASAATDASIASALSDGDTTTSVDGPIVRGPFTCSTDPGQPCDPNRVRMTSLTALTATTFSTAEAPHTVRLLAHIISPTSDFAPEGSWCSLSGQWPVVIYAPRFEPSPVSGDRREGDFIISVTFPRNAAEFGGNIYACNLLTVDGGNYGVSDQGPLTAGGGFPSLPALFTIHQTDPGDIRPPQIDATFDRPSIDVSRAGGWVTATVTMSDDRSGVTSNDAALTGEVGHLCDAHSPDLRHGYPAQVHGLVPEFLPTQTATVDVYVPWNPETSSIVLECWIRDGANNLQFGSIVASIDVAFTQPTITSIDLTTIGWSGDSMNYRMSIGIDGGDPIGGTVACEYTGPNRLDLGRTDGSWIGPITHGTYTAQRCYMYATDMGGSAHITFDLDQLPGGSWRTLVL